MTSHNRRLHLQGSFQQSAS